MAPVVHGLEQQYKHRIDFVYLNVAEPRNAEAKGRFGFKATPHFFFLRPDGSPMQSMQGVHPADSVRLALDRLLVETSAPRSR